MKRAALTVLAFVVIAPTFCKEPAPTVTFASPCECIAFHGINRWVAKTDLSPVASDKSAIQAIVFGHCYKIGVKQRSRSFDPENQWLRPIPSFNLFC